MRRDRAGAVAAFLLGQTWVQIQADLSALPEEAPPAPSLDSLMRWGKAFAGHALRWLQAVLAVLASVWPHLPQLDAHGVRPTSPPQQLVQALAVGILREGLLALAEQLVQQP